MRVVIAGGGTGGHVYPGLAVAEALASLAPEAEIVFAGGDGLERRVVPRAGWPFRRILSRPWTRSGLRRIPGAALTAAGLAQSVVWLSRWRPRVVLATGGYAALPVGLAAVLLGIPLVVQEQNVVPGAANRLLARWARAVSVPHGAAGLGPRTVVTGVPVRSAALDGDRDRGRRRFRLEEGRTTVLILGGSQGARSLNAAAVRMAPALAGSPVQILHQTGEAHYAWVQRERDGLEASPPYTCVPYIEHVADAYACADLVVCRAGAGTLAEATAHGLPVVAVPYPHAASAHQEANARVLEEAGAAVVIADRDLSPRRLADTVADLCARPQVLQAMARASRSLGRPDAAREVAGLVLQAAGGRP
ncbi:MAG: undecaprenyldiphospho-muramoylpentapeptide beta-N-acetylglucosaminyltransferase [Armatimonadota bacterium]|nr:undecaprenyldiphospho-muramoylpentapeptide beta-N-acetylglucosaminyltransferase [Armatimonadota bacterium]MDR7404043.1 undecaprenyldiphospho-muramoylpentapeptide beta-N-acetylglucosaminyltransferase [Armatimonadota bacterium]MDR7517850.1 undecaprenyldiphospho-muramoylpentapeptide beta-N-acetylglucosaminyltransferase [Armatimonadota bacterium]MDR7561278.1 undecaprenyldiphospho-muramoylpentapeptide beta-N-acetylglucosaminyltransferase [Armatimonadota bacterium]MDR7588166.1 undecaprenyldiphosph